MDTKKRITIAAAVGVPLLMAVIWFSVSRKPGASSGPVVAQVGDFALTESDVAFRDEVAKVQKSIDGPSGRDQLLKSYARIQLLKEYGMTVTETMIQEEEQKLRRSALPGSYLSKVFAIFGDNHEALRRVYLIPLIGDRMLYQDYFVKKSPDQLEAKKKAEAFLAAYRKEPESGSALAASKGLKLEKVSVTRSGGLRWEGVDSKPKPKLKANPAVIVSKTPPPKESPEGVHWFVAVLPIMKEGDVRSDLVEFGDFWLAVRLLSHTKKGEETYHLEAVKLPKVRYREWVQKEVAKVSVTSH